MLVDLLMEEKNYEKCVEILTRSLEYESNNKLHRKLGDCYTSMNEPDKALHHHTIASNDSSSSRLEVNYRNSAEASQRLESQSNATSTARLHGNNTASAIELEGDEVAESENDMDESESEVVWSDNDF
jgi:tetratricopeptide (TPR) repeat protein